MPIDNGSSIWPKVLTCKFCKQPVERNSPQQSRVGMRIYSCPTCEEQVESVNTDWVPKATFAAISFGDEIKGRAREAGS